MDYLTDPAAIYRQSFATIRAEADLSALPASAEGIAVRMIHACGMVDLAADLVIHAQALAAGQAALAAGAAVLADAQMTARGVIRNRLAAENPVLCTLDDPGVADDAKAKATTRSAAAVDRWVGHLDGAVVTIGNAPTALFRLIEIIQAGGPRPALIIACPVGFVGAAESKDFLLESLPEIPHVVVRGRRGGSAMASAAVNALSSKGESAS